MNTESHARIENPGGETLSKADINKKIGQTALRPSLAPKVNMDDDGYFPPAVVREHKRYIQKTEARFGNDPDRGKLARDFEGFFIQGIRTGGWLGHKVTNGITASAANASRYDDLKHRIDVFSTLYYKNSKDNKTHAPVVGMDVTISGNRNVIMDKLTRSSNDSQDGLPFGFSRIDYYTNGVVKKNNVLVPRYVVGVSGYDVMDINQTVKVNSATKMMSFDLNTAKNMENRFKILSEINAENQLYLAMEPEITDDSLKELRLAHNRLVVLGRKMKKALAVAAINLKESGFMKNLPDTDNDDKLISAIEDRLLEEGQAYFKEEQEKYIMRGGAVTDDLNDDTYAQIINCARELTMLAKEGKLDKYKGAMARNRKIEC